jgi:hypothetical protein
MGKQPIPLEKTFRGLSLPGLPEVGGFHGVLDKSVTQILIETFEKISNGVTYLATHTQLVLHSLCSC